jgi:addiction module HigA family antidote
VLKSLIAESGMKQQDFADRISTSRVAVNQVVNGKRGLTPLMALKLEAALGISARSILENQTIVDLARAYEENKDVIEKIRSNPVVRRD